MIIECYSSNFDFDGQMLKKQEIMKTLNIYTKKLHSTLAIYHFRQRNFVKFALP